MRSLSETDLICQLQVDLNREFYDEEFLLPELEGVVQALVSSVGWAAIMSSQSQDGEPVTCLKTEDHFSNKFMGRGQIVSTIENTSGLNPEMSDYALTIIETRLDREIENESAVEVEHIGVVEATKLPHYIIHLNDELKVAPPRMDDRFEEGVIASTLQR